MTNDPKLQTTSLWYAAGQQLDDDVVGDPRFEGRTPAYVPWNLLQRYTRPGDVVLDPFCGGGTTIDVAKRLDRIGRGFDVAPRREDIEFGDARKLPLEAESVDFVFMDPPYSTHLEYSNSSQCIGKLDAFDGSYFDAMEQVFDEALRVLRNRRYMAVYVSDSFRKKRGFVGIGAELFVMLRKRFTAVDHIAVVRGNRKLEKPRFHRAAAEQNFFLRGYNHLMIFKKAESEQ